MTTLLRTTIAGSLPKPAWLAEPEALWAPWKLEGAALAEGKRDAVRLALRDQEQAGIDIVTDGEQTRRHFVTTFIEGLDGVDFEHKKTVRIRNRYDADVPVVVGAGRAAAPGLRRRRRASCARRRPARVKYTLPGPMTMVDTLYDAHYGSREKLAWAFAEILNEEARAIEAAGVDVIQFDEPAFNVYFDEVRDWGIAALERAARGPRLHDRGAHLLRLRHQGEHRLEEDARQANGGSTSRRFPRLAASTIDQVSLECANSHVPIELIGLLEGKDVLVGRHRRRHRPGRDAGGRRRTYPLRAAVRPGRTAAALHQLRDGAAGPGRRAGQAARAGRRRRAGPARIDVLTAVDGRSGALSPNPASGAGFRRNTLVGAGRKRYRFFGKICV